MERSQFKVIKYSRYTEALRRHMRLYIFVVVDFMHYFFPRSILAVSKPNDDNRIRINSAVS